MNNKNTKLYDLKCTIEELYWGKLKRFRIRRNIFLNGDHTCESKILDIKIMSGWKEGTKITFDNMGDQIQNKKPDDIVFIVKQIPHNLYTRIDNNLHITYTVSLYDALNGFQKTVKTLNGKREIIVINNLVESNYKYIIKNGGMPIRKNSKIVGHGDLIVNFNINFATIPFDKKCDIITILKEN